MDDFMVIILFLLAIILVVAGIMTGAYYLSLGISLLCGA